MDDRIRETFDFTAARDRLRTRYPEETANLTCLDSESETDRQTALKWLNNASPQFLTAASHVPQGHPTQRAFAALFILDTLAGAASTSIFDPVLEKALIVMQGRPEKSSSYTGLHAELNSMILHEHGHYIAPGGIPPSHRNKLNLTPAPYKERLPAESAADVFSAAEGLATDVLETGDIRRLSLYRAVSAWLNKAAFHTTSLALDNFMLEHESTDFLSLNPREIQTVSAAHAHRFTVSDEDMSALTALTPNRLASTTPDDLQGPLEKLIGKIGIWPKKRPEQLTQAFAAKTKQYESHVRATIQNGSETQADRQLWLSDLIDAAAKAPDNSLAFYAPAKVAAHILNTGLIDYPLTRIFDVAGSAYNPARRMLHEKAARMGMEKALAIRL